MDVEASVLPTLLLVAAQAAPPVLKLNGRLAQPIVSGLDGVLLSPDERWTVFRSDLDTDDRRELFSAPVDGSRPRAKLNPPLASGERVGAFALAPAADAVLFLIGTGLWRAPIDAIAPAARLGAPSDLMSTFWLDPSGARVLCGSIGGSSRLFSLSLDGSGSSVTLDGGSPAFVRAAAVTPDGRSAVYAIGPSFGRAELRSVPLDGSRPPVRLDPGAGLDASGDFALAPDGATAVFRTDALVPGQFELFGAPVEGGSARRLCGALAPDEDVAALAPGTFAFLPDGERCAYLAGNLAAGAVGLHVAPLDGRQPALDLLAPVAVSTFRVAPDGRSLLYRSTGGELFTVTLDSRPLHRQLTRAEDGVVGPFHGFDFALDGKQVVFTRMDPALATFSAKLHTVDAAGRSAPRPLASPTDIVHRVTSDGQHVLFTTSDSHGAQLFGVLPDGSEPALRLSHEYSAQAFQFHTAARGPNTRVVFLDGGDVASASVAGGKYRRLSEPLLGPSNAFVGSFRLAPDGQSAVYTADQEGSGPDLYLVPSDGSALPRRLTDAFHQGRSRFGFQLSPDGRWAVDPFIGSGTGQLLRSVELSDKREAVLISGALPFGQDVGGGTFMPFEFVFRFSPDSRRVLYAADQDTNGVIELYSTPIDGSAPPVRLNPAYTDTHDLFLTGYQPAFEVDAASTLAVYLANQDQVGKVELYSVPVAGGPSLRLHPALGARRDVRSFALAPDGVHVLYVADPDVESLFELFSVPIAGGEAPVKVNGPLSPAVGADVGGQNPDWIARHIAFLPGGRVVYRVDRDVEEYYELFNAPIDGSSTPIELPLLAPSESVEPSFVAALGGTRIVYLSSRRGPNAARELYSVASDGRSAPVRLNGQLVPLGNVGPSFGVPEDWFRLDPSGTRVVYTAEQRARLQQDLYSVPVDRSAEPVRLNELPGPASVLPGFFGVSPDGMQVWFRVDRRMYLVPIDGSAAPRLLFDELGVSVENAVQLASGPTRVLFLADPEVPGHAELYASLLGEEPLVPGSVRH